VYAWDLTYVRARIKRVEMFRKAFIEIDMGILNGFPEFLKSFLSFFEKP
jgi:hypothetical protein